MKKRDVGILLLTIGGVAIAIISIRKDLEREIPFLPDWFYKICLLLGVFCCTIGILSIVLPIEVIRKAIRRIRESLGWGVGSYQVFVANRKDLAVIHKYAERELGTVSDLQRMEKWLTVNSYIFWIFVDNSIRGSREEQMVGYYCIIPLKKGATDLVEAEQLDGTTFNPEHIILHRRRKNRSGKPASIYIGAIAAKKKLRIRHFVLGSVISHINQEVEKGVKVVFSRPVTDDGLRLVKKYQFKPVNKFVQTLEKNHIYKREFDPDEDTGA